MSSGPGVGPHPIPDSPLDHYRVAQARGLAIAELCRLQISRVPILVMVAASVAHGGGVGTTVAGVVLIAASCAIGAALNDRADVVSDRRNQRTDRPLASGTLGERDVRAVIAVATAAIVAAEWWLPQPTGLIVAALAAFVAWSTTCEPVALQRRGLAGLVALGVGYLVLPILLVVGVDQLLVLLPLALLGGSVLAHKDVRDELGDRLAGKRTLLLRLGYVRMARTAAGLGIAAVVSLSLTIGASWWIVPAVLTVGALITMRSRHSPAVWLAARVALVATAVLVATHAA